jgi:hypothetical protein
MVVAISLENGVSFCRLELYMKQNHENVERAETELNTLHEDMEHTLELQRRLAQRFFTWLFPHA